MVWEGVGRDTVNLVRLPTKADEMPTRIYTARVFVMHTEQNINLNSFHKLVSPFLPLSHLALLFFIFFSCCFSDFAFFLLVKLSAQIWHLADEKLA